MSRPFVPRSLLDLAEQIEAVSEVDLPVGEVLATSTYLWMEAANDGRIGTTDWDLVCGIAAGVIARYMNPPRRPEKNMATFDPVGTEASPAVDLGELPPAPTPATSSRPANVFGVYDDGDKIMMSVPVPTVISKGEAVNLAAHLTLWADPDLSMVKALSHALNE